MRQIILATAAYLFAVPAFAANDFSAEVLFGRSDQALDVSATSFSESSTQDSGLFLDSHSTSYGFIGGYQFSQYVAVELSYQKYGEFTSVTNNSTHLKLNSNATQLGIKGILPLPNGYSINCRLGFASWDLNNSRKNPNPGDDISKLQSEGKDPYYGVGAEYRINKNLFVGLSYSVLSMHWDEREEGESYVFLMDFEHEIKNISFSVGAFF